MGLLVDFVLDLALAELDVNMDRIDICSQQPANLTEATSTFSLGNKTGITVGAPADGTPNGRQVTVSAITDGTVTATGTATHWAGSDAGTRLLAANTLSASQGVTNGNQFSLTSFNIRIPDAA